jgi:hypothetical protein
MAGMSDYRTYRSHASEPEQPRQEPEIIPPGRGDPRWRQDDPNVFVYVDHAGRTRKFRMTTPGPLTVIFILLTLGLMAAAILAVALSAVLFLIPIAAVTLAGVVAYAYARGFWRRLTGR